MTLRVVLGGSVGFQRAGGEIEEAGPGRLARLTLAYLVSERRPVPREELADVLWGEDLPASWEQMVRGAVSSLRGSLRRCGLAGEALETAHGCYHLRLPPGVAVDVEAAATSLAAAEAKLAEGDGEAAQVEAEATVAIASRQFAPGTTGRWAEVRQAELRELHLRALETLAQAAEAEGRWAAAVQAAEEAVGIEPLRESAYMRLMSAHAGAGHRGEALRAYERCRRVLAEELGVRPAAPTESAYLALLVDEPSSPEVPPPVERLALPAAVGWADGAFLVGRDDATQRLAAALERATQEGRQAVFVAGEPGVGKTALVSNFACAAHRRGARVLYGRCDEELGVAYQPFAEALGHLIAQCSLAELADHVAIHGGELLRLVPQLGRRLTNVPAPPTTDPEADRFRLFEAVSGLLTAAAGKGTPLVVVLDDLHWAAHATLLLLRHVMRSAEPAALVVVATYRHTDIGPDHPVAATLADLRRVPTTVERINLGGLDEAGVAAYLEATWDRSLEPDDLVLARAVHTHTAGNPFFVGELLRHLAESGAVYRREGPWSYYQDAEGLGIPDGVREVVVRRLRRLGEAANRALVLAAVIGTEFDLDLLEAISEGADAAGVLDALDEAATGRLVVEEGHGRFRFTHALVRDTIHSGLIATRRGRLHRRVGEAIESLTPTDDAERLPALAHHFAEAAAAGTALKAADYALAAARQAVAEAAWEDAAALLDRGLIALDGQTAPDLERKCDLLLLLAETWTRFFHPPRAVQVAALATETARTIGDATRFGEAAYWLLRSGAGANPYGSGSAEVTGLAREALTGLGEEEPGLRARLAALLVSPVDPNQEAELRDLLALARSSDDPLALGAVLARCCAALRGSPRIRDYFAYADELVSAAPPSGWEGWRNGYSFRAMARLASGDRRGFEADLEACARFGTERRFWYFVWLSAVWRASVALLDGRYDEVEDLATTARDSGPVIPLTGPLRLRQLYRLNFDLGNLDVSRALAIQLVREAPGNEIHEAMLAFIDAELDGVERDRPRFQAMVDEGFGPMPPERWPVTLAYRTEVAVLLGGDVRAAALYDEFLPYRDQVVIGGMSESCLGAVDRYLGMLCAEQGRWDEAEAHFDTALAMEAGLRSPPLASRTRYWFGRMLLARQGPGDADRAAGLLATAEETARRLGMAGVTADIGRLRASA